MELCSLSAADTKALETADDGQRRQLHFQDLLNSNARTLIKRVLEASSSSSEFVIPKYHLDNLTMADRCLE